MGSEVNDRMLRVPAILVIERDAKLVTGVEHALLGVATVCAASCAKEVDSACRDSGDFSVILSPPCLPKLETSELTTMLRELQPNAVRVLMVGSESVRALTAAVNAWSPFRVLHRPFTAEVLRQTVGHAQQAYERGNAERRVVEETLHGSLEAMAGMLAVVQPAAFGRAARLRRMVTLLAERIGLTDTWDLQTAAMVSQFAAVSLPAELVDRLSCNRPIVMGEAAQVLAALEATLHVLERIPRMARVCEILRAVELLPSGLRGSLRRSPATRDAERVLTLVLDFDGLYAEHGSACAALRVMESLIERYHAPYFDAMRELVGAPNAAPLVDLPLSNARIGQIFAADVRAPNGILLIARGQPVTSPLLTKIRYDWQAFAAKTMVRMIDDRSASALASEKEGEEDHRAA